MMMPGTKPPINNLPTLTLAMVPYSSSGMDGGIIGPMEPPQASRGAEKLFS